MTVFLFAFLQPLGLMAALRHLIATHPLVALTVILLTAVALINAAVQAMEEPDAASGKGYRYLYRFAHFAVFNFRYALRKKFPDYIPPEPADAALAAKSGGQ